MKSEALLTAIYSCKWYRESELTIDLDGSSGGNGYQPFDGNCASRAILQHHSNLQPYPLGKSVFILMENVRQPRNFTCGKILQLNYDTYVEVGNLKLLKYTPILCEVRFHLFN